MGGARLISATALATLALAASADAASVSPDAVIFGDKLIGTSSDPVSVTLTTSPSKCPPPGSPNGCMPASAFSLTSTSALGGGPGTTTSSNDFTVHNTNCQYPTLVSPDGVAASRSCRFEVSFAPTASGSRALSLSFPDNLGPTATLALGGQGVAAMSPVVAGPRKCKRRKNRAAAAKKRCKPKKKKRQKEKRP